MIKRNVSRLLAVAILAATVQSFGCTDANLTKAAQASQNIALGIQAAMVTKDDLAKAGVLSNAEVIQIDKILLLLVRADTAFVNQAKTYKTFDATAKATLAALFASISSGLGQFQAATASLQTQKAKDALGPIIAGMQVSSAVIQALVGT